MVLSMKQVHRHTYARAHINSVWRHFYLLQLLNDNEGEAENVGPASMLPSVRLCQHYQDSHHLCSVIFSCPWKMATYKFPEIRGGSFGLARFLHFPFTRAGFRPVWWGFDPRRGRVAWIMDRLISRLYVDMEKTNTHLSLKEANLLGHISQFKTSKLIKNARQRVYRSEFGL